MLNISILYFQVLLNIFHFGFIYIPLHFRRHSCGVGARDISRGNFLSDFLEIRIITSLALLTKLFWLHVFCCIADGYDKSGLVKNTHPLLKVFMWKRNGSYGRSKETLWHCYGFYVFAQGPAWSEEGAGRGSSDPYQQHSFLPPSFSLRCLGRYVR